MRYDTLVRRTISLATVAALAVVMGCDDDDEDPVQEPDIETMRVTIGQTAVDFTGGCTPNPAVVTIPTTGAAVDADFLQAGGAPDPVVTAANFELRVTPEDRFTRIDAFSGTLSGGAVGSAQIAFSLFHTEEGHVEYGPCSVQVDVQ